MARMQTRATSRPAVRKAILSLNPRNRDYRRMRRALMNFILEEIAERHYKAYQAKMMGGSDEFRRKWKPLSPATVKKKGHSRIGYDRGQMLASFMPGYTTPDGHYMKGHPDQIAEATAYSVKFGTKAIDIRKGKRRPKSVFFHYGTKHPDESERQPAREFWRQREINRWVAAGIKKGVPKIMRLMR